MHSSIKPHKESGKSSNGSGPGASGMILPAALVRNDDASRGGNLPSSASDIVAHHNESCDGLCGIAPTAFSTVNLDASRSFIWI